MRLCRIFLVFALSSTALWAAEAKKYVQPKESNVGVYKNQVRQVYEQPVFKVGPEDRLLILETKGDNYRVQNVDGKNGWVEKRLVAQIGKSKSFVFDNAEVVGYLDNPTPVYILDSDDPNADRIYLDRSFKEALRDNTDLETTERQASK
jgi:hypothetical protein